MIEGEGSRGWWWREEGRAWLVDAKVANAYIARPEIETPPSSKQSAPTRDRRVSVTPATPGVTTRRALLQHASMARKTLCCEMVVSFLALHLVSETICVCSLAAETRFWIVACMALKSSSGQCVLLSLLHGAGALTCALENLWKKFPPNVGAPLPPWREREDHEDNARAKNTDIRSSARGRPGARPRALAPSAPLSHRSFTALHCPFFIVFFEIFACTARHTDTASWPT